MNNCPQLKSQSKEVLHEELVMSIWKDLDDQESSEEDEVVEKANVCLMESSAY